MFTAASKILKSRNFILLQKGTYKDGYTLYFKEYLRIASPVGKRKKLVELENSKPFRAVFHDQFVLNCRTGLFCNTYSL